MKKMIIRSDCRVCHGKNTVLFLSLGDMPPVNAFLSREELNNEEETFPLDVYFCPDCTAIQLMKVVSPEILFRNYHYMTGANKPMIEHFSELAADAIFKSRAKSGDLIIDIGSNDGTLLSMYKKNGFDNILGIEPSVNISKIANDSGIRTCNEFFSQKTSSFIKEHHGSAKIITATNVFAHVDDLDDFIDGIKNILSDDGIFIIEVPYAMNFLKNNEFDTIYHEHLSYFTIHALQHLFRRFGMNIFDVKSIPVHGGSIRVYVSKESRNLSENAGKMINYESEFGISRIETYEKFAKAAEETKKELLAMLHSLRQQGLIITGYGASAKGNVLLNYCGIGPELLDYVSDTTPIKQGKFTPGMHIHVVSEEHFHKNFPDVSLMLAWNYSDDIIMKEKEFLSKGGRFIIPIPKPVIIHGDKI